MSNIKAYRPTGSWLFSILFFVVLSFSFNSAQAQDIEAGEKLFKTNCATCHRLDSKKLTGPGLEGLEDRVPSREWLYDWIKDSPSLIASGDAYANEIFNEYDKVPMSQFQFLTNEDIDNILAYVANPPVKEEVVEEAPVETAEEDDPVLWLIILLIVLAIVVNVLLGVRRSLQNLVLEREGKQPLEDVTHWMAFKSWVGNNQTKVVVFCLLIGMIAAKDGFIYLKNNIGVYQNYAPEQPIKYSHKIHAGDNGINCVYCHTGAEKGRTAGIPSANVCMNCHKVIDQGSTTGTEEIAKIYKAVGWNSDKMEYDPEMETTPIVWNKIHNLPDFVYFNHSQHVVVGKQECQTCHGEVESFDYPMKQENDLTMGWCVDCHRETNVPGMGSNEYYDKMHAELKEKYAEEGKTSFTVEDIGGLECAKCHY